MDLAVLNNKRHVVYVLMDNPQKGCTKYAMQYAASYGYIGNLINLMPNYPHHVNARRNFVSRSPRRCVERSVNSFMSKSKLSVSYQAQKEDVMVLVGSPLDN
jgi:hypothetical protein